MSSIAHLSMEDFKHCSKSNMDEQLEVLGWARDKERMWKGRQTLLNIVGGWDGNGEVLITTANGIADNDKTLRELCTKEDGGIIDIDLRIAFHRNTRTMARHVARFYAFAHNFDEDNMMAMHRKIMNLAMADLDALKDDNAGGIWNLSLSAKTAKASKNENAHLEFANVMRENYTHRMEIIEYVNNVVAKRRARTGT